MAISAEELRKKLAAAREQKAFAQSPGLALGGQVVSMVRNATETKTRDITVTKVLEAIRTGGTRLKWQIQRIRNGFEAELAISGGDLGAAKRAVDGLKKALPGVMWCGRFSNRELPAADKLQKHSGLLCADLDDLGDKLPEIRKKLEASSHVFAFFLSPSGNGLKVVFRILADAQKHAGSFRAVEKYVRDLTGIEIDPKRKDIAGLCFMSFDPDLYVNWFAIAIHPLPEPEKPKAAFNSSGEANLSERQRIAGEMLGNVKWTSETSGYCVCPGKHRHTTGDDDRDCKIDFDGVPTVHCFHNHCRGILDAINRELRPRIGKAEFVPTLVRLGDSNLQAADDDSTELTSLSSLGAAEYPATLEEAAYYGLAGDVVRRIGPHTEADPVALLVHYVDAFGNAVGRGPHAVADGSRHGTNIFIVCVGKSSKSRKGTSSAHTKRIIRRSDEAWGKECVTSGLSSGEGLIYSVRDPVVKSVKQKDGSYAKEVVDDGVADKRRLFIESEFASTLRVMSREGNTLSAVIRQAWDDGDLRTAVKNSPNSATGAHISIMAHVTRDEVRRELCATDQANGFANRFFWFAVQRSKCLPEGGNLDQDSLNDLMMRTHRAIEFARTVGLVTRDDAAKKLWWDVYPKLSEGKSGLLGAITARAEAQVLRLSVIYALLDCSAVVRVEHLKAALAVWRYSEDSARWIFGSGTGKKNADRVLAALKAAGKKGLTKWQITSGVFNRHATKFEIDEALRLLHSLKLARCERESTATRHAERWFYMAQGREECEESAQKDGKTVDTSRTSHPPPSQNESSAESDAEADKFQLLQGPTSTQLPNSPSIAPSSGDVDAPRTQEITDSGEPKSEAVSGDLQL